MANKFLESNWYLIENVIKEIESIEYCDSYIASKINVNNIKFIIKALVAEVNKLQNQISSTEDKNK